MFSPALVEFLGTALLVSAVALGSPLMIIAALATAISFGGKISGGHFNPAVTLFQYVSGRVSRSRALYYVLAQLAAGVSVGLVAGML